MDGMIFWYWKDILVERVGGSKVRRSLSLPSLSTQGFPVTGRDANAEHGHLRTQVAGDGHETNGVKRRVTARGNIVSHHHAI